MKKFLFLFVSFSFFFLAAHSFAYADWVECPLTVAGPGGATLSGSGSDKTLYDLDHEFIGVHANCTPDSHGLKVQFQTSAPANIYFQNTNGSFVYHTFSGTGIDSYILTDPDQLSSFNPVSAYGMTFGDPGTVPVTYTHFQVFNWLSASPQPSPSPSPTSNPMPSPSTSPAPSLSPAPTLSPIPTPTPAPLSASATISVSAPTSTVTVGTPFKVDVAVDGGGQAFNAAQAAITVSSNLLITGFQYPSAGSCNFQYTQTPSVTNPSFAGAIANSSVNNCKVYTLTLTPTAAGNGTVVITSGSVKSYANSGEILNSVANGSFPITTQGQVSILPSLTEKNLSLDTYPVDTYNSTMVFTGEKDASLNHIFQNGSETGITYPTSATWQATTPSLTLGSNIFTFYGKDTSSNQTPPQSILVIKHALGDINGDGVVDLTDASLFAVDWGKTTNLTYSLSDMDGDGKVDLTDFSILAKHEVSL